MSQRAHAQKSLTADAVESSIFLPWSTDAPAAPTSPEQAAEAAPAPASPPPPKRRGYSVKAWENRDDLELEA